MNLKLGVLISSDPTMNGRIMSEFLCFNTIYATQKQFNHNLTMDLIVLSASGLRLIKKHEQVSLVGETCFDFPHKTILANTIEDIECISEEYDILLTTRNYNVLYGGSFSDRAILHYKLCTLFTRKNKPIMVREGDSENAFCDYLQLSRRRGKKIDVSSLPEKRDFLENQQFIDYNNVYWLANGSPKKDWVYSTILYKKSDGPIIDLVSEEVVKGNTVYISDDIFFSVKKHYNKYEHFINNVPTNNSFCFIGFMTGINKTRAKVFKSLLKENPEKNPPFHFFGDVGLFTSNTPNVHVEQGSILGSSDEYFEFINSHLAYVFVGKGSPNYSYIGKTCYDSIVARTPIVVYSKCDIDRSMFPDNPEFYFDDIEGLASIYETLQDHDIRSNWLNVQTEIIFKELDVDLVDLSLLCQTTRV